MITEWPEECPASKSPQRVTYIEIRHGLALTGHSGTHLDDIPQCLYLYALTKQLFTALELFQKLGGAILLTIIEILRLV